VQKAQPKLAKSPKSKKKKKSKQQKPKPQAVVYEELAQLQPVLDKDADGRAVPVASQKFCLLLRHGVPEKMRKLSKLYYIAILLPRNCSKARQKQIFECLRQKRVCFDAIYQHVGPFDAEPVGGTQGEGRFFSPDRILYETGYSAAKTLFVTPLEQTHAQPLDLNDTLDKGGTHPLQAPDPAPQDFGLLPLPYTMPVREGLNSFRMDFHKLVVVGVPHAQQSSGSAQGGKARAMSFKHICSVLKNFHELCESIERAARQARKEAGSPRNGSAAGSSAGGSESSDDDSSYDDSDLEYAVKPKYRRLYDPAAEDPRLPSGRPQDGGVAKAERREPAAELQKTEEQEGSASSTASAALLKEHKTFYKGFAKALEHGLFSLAYSRQAGLAKVALRAKLSGHLVTYRRKLAKIDGLAARLLRLRAR
jgi:hypothetical protein